VKILDRYLLTVFVKNYLISFMSLIGLYIALDMVFNFDSLVEPPRSAATMSLTAPRVMADIAAYYVYQTPLIFAYLSGIIAVVGAAFTLMRMSRFNELTAILAAGVSLRRVALPIVLAGVALNGLLLADQELLIPAILPKLIRSHDEMHTATPKTYVVQMMRDDRNGLLSAARFTPPGQPTGDGNAATPATMEFMDVVERDEQLRPCGHLSADVAMWDDSAKLWRLKNGLDVKILRPQDNRPEPPAHVTTYQSDITPDEIALWRGGQYVQLLPTWRINELLQRPKSYGVVNLLRTKNLRLTQPLANIILLLLACPTVLTREPGRLKTSALRCLILCGLCMGAVFLAYQLAATPPSPDWARQWPALMAWTPIFIFGPLSVGLLDIMKT
jgi:lipopolysaccharide export system permease protein